MAEIRGLIKACDILPDANTSYEMFAGMLVSAMIKHGGTSCGAFKSWYWSLMAKPDWRYIESVARLYLLLEEYWKNWLWRCDVV